MKSKLREFTKNFSYTFTVNILSLFIGALVTLIIPKLISTEQYGYYQTYLFYLNYVGVSYLGWCDGILLRIGGQYYQELDKPLYSAQFWILGAYEAFFYAIIFAAGHSLFKNADQSFVIACICIAAVGICLRYFIMFVLQGTARIKEYAIVTIVERIAFIVGLVLLIIFKCRNFYLILCMDILAKSISLLLGILYCRDVVFARPRSIRTVYPEIRKNVSVGIHLMFSSLCSMLIMGVVRIGMQNHWDIATFGKVSLTLNISNMIMTAINAIAIVMYPTLRRTNANNFTGIYRIMRIILMGVIFGVLVFYYPIQRILTAWLPQYSESLRYAAILFPICVYESKISLLISTYYKTLRLESLLMKCNIIALAVSVFCTFFSIFILDNMMVAILSVLFVVVFRCVLCETQLAKHIAIHVQKDIVIELAMTMAFIVCNWFFGVWGMIAYFICYLIYISLKRNDIKETLTFIRSMR